MSGSFKSDGITVFDLINCTGPGHLAEVATYALGVAFHERARRRGEETSRAEAESPCTDDEADSALALAVIDDNQSDLGLAVPESKRAFVEQLYAIKCIALGHRAGLVADHQA